MGKCLAREAAQGASQHLNAGNPANHLTSGAGYRGRAASGRTESVNQRHIVGSPHHLPQRPARWQPGTEPGSQQQTYVIDTSVLLSDPHALRRFAEHDVVCRWW